MDVIRVQPLNVVAEESRFDFVVDHFADFIDGFVSSPEMVWVGADHRRPIGDVSLEQGYVERRMNPPAIGKGECRSEGLTVFIVNSSDGERSHEPREELSSSSWPILQIFRREHDFLADKEGNRASM